MRVRPVQPGRALGHGCARVGMDAILAYEKTGRVCGGLGGAGIRRFYAAGQKMPGAVPRQAFLPLKGHGRGRTGRLCPGEADGIRAGRGFIPVQLPVKTGRVLQQQ